MSLIMPVNSCGSTIEVEDVYLNETGDKMKGTLDLDGNKLINGKEPEDPNDVVNKEYLEKHYIKRQDMYNI